MPIVDELAQAIRDLPPEELRRFRESFVELDAELWDRQIEEDLASGRLGGLLEEAQSSHRDARARPL